MTIEIEGLPELMRKFKTVPNQINYASMLTLNDLAFDARESLNKEIEHKMKVRKNTAKAFVVDKATKSELTATVRMKSDWHWLALKHHYFGGEAEQIAFERAMIARGYMTDSNSAIPIKKMGKAKYRTVLNATRPALRGSKYFVVKTRGRSNKTKHLAPGVYERMRRKVKPIVLFTREAKYRKRFDMYATVEKVVDRRAADYFWKNFAKAMRTAR